MSVSTRIAGHRLVVVRELLRRAVREPLSPAAAAACLGSKRDPAEATLVELEHLGLVQRDEDGFRPTERGRQLAHSRANRGITETTAEKVVERVIARAKDINQRSEIPWTVERLGVRDPPTAEDALLRHVEIVVQLGVKSGGNTERRATEEVFQRLRERSKHLVLVEALDWPEQAREVFARRSDAT